MWKIALKGNKIALEKKKTQKDFSTDQEIGSVHFGFLKYGSRF